MLPLQAEVTNFSSYKWVKKYGKNIADEKEQNRKQLISNAMKGKNNPMYGKPAPQGSGNGWSGHYKNTQFRSLLELYYLIYLIDNNIKFENGELKKACNSIYNEWIRKKLFPRFLFNRYTRNYRN